MPIRVFRKKPIEIRAIEWTKFNFEEVRDFACEGLNKHQFPAVYLEEDELFIDTLEGVMHASVNDWIIRGVQGELYPCKPDIFKVSYEEIEEVNHASS